VHRPHVRDHCPVTVHFPDSEMPRRGRFAAGAIVVSAAALVSGSLAWLLALVADGTRAEEYESGSRFAASALLLTTVGLTTVAALVSYWLARTFRRRSRLGFSVMVGLTPCLLAVALVPWLWNR
jgi:hypothetical protein